MVVADNVVDVVLKVLRGHDSFNIQNLDSDTLNELSGKLKESIAEELDLQGASLYPIYGNDMSVAFHNLRSTMRRLGVESEFTLYAKRGDWTAIVEGNGTSFPGENTFIGQFTSKDPAVAMDEACRSALIEMAKKEF